WTDAVRGRPYFPRPFGSRRGTAFVSRANGSISRPHFKITRNFDAALRLSPNTIARIFQVNRVTPNIERTWNGEIYATGNWYCVLAFYGSGFFSIVYLCEASCTVGRNLCSGPLSYEAGQ